MKKEKNNRKHIKVLDLAEFVRSTMAEKGLTTYEVARRADNKIAQTYVSAIVNRKVTCPGIKKLEALAAGIGVPADKVIELARNAA